MTGTTGGQFEVRGDEDWFRVRFEAGKTYQINGSTSDFALELFLPDGTLLNPPVAYSNQITFVAPVTGDYWLAANDFSGLGPYSVSAVEITDPNPASTATSLSLAVGQTVDISNAVAQDWHSVSFVAGQSYFLTSSNLTDQLYLTDSTGQLITLQSNQLHYTATATGDYFVGVAPSFPNYSLSLETVADDHGESAATAGSLAVGGSVGGVWETGNDSDWYAVTLNAGSSYSLALTLPGDLTAGAEVDVYDSSGKLVKSALPYYAVPTTVFSPDSTGTYYISAHVGSEYYTPHGNWSYSLSAHLLSSDLADNTLTSGTLSIGGTASGDLAAPADSDWYAVTLTAGQSYVFTMDALPGDLSIALHDASGAELTRSIGSISHSPGSEASVAYTAPVSGTYYVDVTAGSQSNYAVTAATFTDDFANNSSTTGVLAVGGTADGTLEIGGDRDWFAVELTAGSSYEFQSTTGATVIRDAHGQALTNWNFYDQHFSPLVSGTYYLEASGGTGAYTVVISEVYDDLRNDTLSGGVLRQTTTGTDANDTFTSTDEHEFFSGLGGDDLFVAGSGYDLYSGGTGTDTVSFANFGAGVVVDLSRAGLFEDDVRRIFIIAVENVDGSAFNDTITGTAGANTLNGGKGIDILTGGAGDDIYWVNVRADVVIEAADGGNDTVHATGNYVLPDNVESLVLEGILDTSATGNALDNQLTGNAGDNVISGAGGNDTIDGGDGTDHLYGGAGNDTFHADAQADLVFENAGEGTDTVNASAGFYLYANIEDLNLDPGAGDIFGVGNELANKITGNEGSNLLIGGGGDDTINGGDGNDSLFGQDGDDHLAGNIGVDYLVGGAGNDVLAGGYDADALYGEDGNDYLDGGTTFDTDILVGGAGDDVLHGDSGLGDYDRMDGGAGNDSYYVDTGDDLTFEAADGGTDTVYANVAGANNGVYLYANVENLVLLGTTTFGVGNELDNVLTGNDSANWLLGGDGNDTLNGKAGGDVLFGQGGNDTFVFEHGTGGDVIGDFTHGEDKIDVHAFGFASFAALQASFHQVGSDGAIDLGGGDLVVLQGVTMASLDAGDFVL